MDFVQVTFGGIGIGLFSDEVLQDDGDRTTRMLLTPAYSRLAQGEAEYSLQGVILRRGDADVAAFDHNANRVVLVAPSPLAGAGRFRPPDRQIAGRLGGKR